MGKKKARRKAARSRKLIYYFGGGRAEGRAADRDLLGSKGANLAEMTSLGLPVPPGFTITTDACAAFFEAGEKLAPALLDQVELGLERIEQDTGKALGDGNKPLLLSVRSGAAVSMPGMLDSVLNLGLNDDTVETLARATGNRRFAFDAYRRLIQMFACVVNGIDGDRFEQVFAEIRAKYAVAVDAEVPTMGLEDLCDRYRDLYRRAVRRRFPQEPREQLRQAIAAVFRSWNAARAQRYRQIQRIAGLRGTGVNLQAMVFGNMGQDCGTGVAFTRDPATGANRLFGEFLVDAQGEDVVAGIRTPRPIAEMPDWHRASYTQLQKIKKTLEDHYREMQDIEFTIERKRLFMLQTRTGKRTGAAAVKIAVDMVKEKRIDMGEALLRVPGENLNQLLLPSFSEADKAKAELLTRGLPASPGAASGTLVFDSAEAVERTRAGDAVLLVRRETSPDDVDGMHHAVGILTATGGMTSHAAVVARGWGKCCIVGAGELSIDLEARRVLIAGRSFGAAERLSLDGTTGEVLLGEVPRSAPQITAEFQTLLKWSDRHRRLAVRANADTPEAARRAREFGAEGVGLCRTEHMFLEGRRIERMREMILAADDPARARALKHLLPLQRRDFIGIFTAMKGRPVTVRLLDPPLHEFLPTEESAQQRVADDLGVSIADIARRVLALRESNPMLGHRGCRVGITFPEITVMQVTAIVEATISCRRQRVKARPEIMIPLVGNAAELEKMRELVIDTIAAVRARKKYSGKLDIPVGSMIEVPRAALAAEQIAAHADFFSFGTNDLTQMTFGYSRDDSNAFLPHYLEQGILRADPFQTIDRDGVGRLVELACHKGRAGNPGLQLGVCGEHGGDPDSIHFFDEAGLDYVSCSPFRVPVARLVAAQSALRKERAHEVEARAADVRAREELAAAARDATAGGSGRARKDSVQA